jgi:hypothetical protein
LLGVGSREGEALEKMVVRRCELAD